MISRALVTLNACIATAAGGFLWTMLPFAQGVACEGQRISGQSCSAPLSSPSLMALSLAPAAVMLVVCAVALRRKAAFWTYAWLSAPIVVATALALFVLTSVLRK